MFGTLNWLLLLFNLFTQAICLKDLKISVPDAVAIGDTVTLSCVYDLEKDALYSIRWYFEQEEFYRYVPREKPPGRIFDARGLNVDLIRSTENTVILKSIQREQSGNYQCEVSADAPFFHTDTRTSAMLVAQLPDSEPVITIYGIPGIENKHAISFGETFKASCVSGYSYPAVNFTWIVNSYRYPSTNTGFRLIDGLNNQEAWSDIIINVDNQLMKQQQQQQHHQQLTLIVRCETNIFNLYRGSAETELNIIRDIYWSPYDGIDSPAIIDHRGLQHHGDPDNSALTDSAGIKHELFFMKIIYNFIKLLNFSFL